MSKVTEIQSEDAFRSEVFNGDDVVVKFWATWCGPCRLLAPHFDKASELVEGPRFLSVDVDEMPAVANELGIMKVPTVLRFRGNERTPVEGRTVVQLMKELS